MLPKNWKHACRVLRPWFYLLTLLSPSFLFPYVFRPHWSLCRNPLLVAEMLPSLSYLPSIHIEFPVSASCMIMSLSCQLHPISLLFPSICWVGKNSPVICLIVYICFLTVVTLHPALTCSDPPTVFDTRPASLISLNRFSVFTVCLTTAEVSSFIPVKP